MYLFVVKLSVGLISLFISGAITGMYITSKPPIHEARLNAHINLAAKPAMQALSPQTEGGSASNAIIAVHTEKLDQIAHENQASVDDRKLLHDELARVQESQVSHFNTLVNRLDVDEAQASTTLKIGGLIFGILQAVPVFFTILDYRSKRSAQNKS